MVSHTTTGEWQSFEMRMRRRRAERLALRAQAAVDAGCFEDARTCLVEARGLAPTLPELDGIERQLPAVPPLRDERPRIEPAVVARASTLEQERAGSSARPRQALAAVGVIATAIALAVWMFLPRGELVPKETAAAQPSVQQSPAAVPRAPDPMPVPSAVFDEETRAAATASVPTDPPAQVPAPEPAPLQPEPRRQELPAAVESTTGALPPARPPESQPRPEAVPVRTEPVPMPIPAPEPTVSPPAVPAAAPVGVLDLPAVVSAPTPPVSAPPPPEPSQEPAVRSVLNRYASAYSALDADAAQRVWPGVNRGALARAFDSLASQQISLGNCRIDVAGARATAMCAGSATWSPKIGGGGPQSETRNWTFELARGGGGWEIVSARVQNR